jgi:hypothetical protein
MQNLQWRGRDFTDIIVYGSAHDRSETLKASDVLKSARVGLTLHVRYQSVFSFPEAARCARGYGREQVCCTDERMA